MFAFNHLFIKINSLFIILVIRSLGVFLNEQVNVLSSMNRVNLKKLEIFRKSFMKIKSNEGPSIDHCRTPQSINRRSDFLSLINMTQTTSKQYYEHHMTLTFVEDFMVYTIKCFREIKKYRKHHWTVINIVENDL